MVLLFSRRISFPLFAAVVLFSFIISPVVLAVRSHISYLHKSPSENHLQTMVVPATPDRPEFVLKALANGENLYYFGLGSNMLRSKIEGRCINGTKIELVSMEPAVVPGYRLSFNMRGFPPMEPGMGSLEPCDAPSKPLKMYHQNECHGALILLTPDNYVKVMKSEGISDDAQKPGYEEIVVDAFPYSSPETPVKAVALRARPHVRLAKEPAPSLRYMNILREGAAELQLKPCYQQFLADYPIETVPYWLRCLAVHNILFTFWVSKDLHSRFFSRAQARLLYLVYAADSSRPVKYLSHAASGLIIFPGALAGVFVRSYYKLTQKEMPVMLSRILQAFESSKPSQPKLEPAKLQTEEAIKLQAGDQKPLSQSKS